MKGMKGFHSWQPLLTMPCPPPSPCPCPCPPPFPAVTLSKPYVATQGTAVTSQRLKGVWGATSTGQTARL